MKKFNYFLILLICFFFSLAEAQKSLDMLVANKELQSTLTPEQALERLKAGNQRYLHKSMRQYDYLAEATVLAKDGQFPFAFVLACMDSRSVPTVLFDQGVGNIFNGAVAGNVVTMTMLASMEYAIYSGAKLIVVMGHTSCGAMKASCQNQGFGNLNQLLGRIQPAVHEAASDGKLDCNKSQTLRRIAIENVYNMLNEVKDRSPYLAKKIANKEVLLMGALHDLATGQVEFFPPKEKNLEKGDNTD